jgi:hypothetical protein
VVPVPTDRHASVLGPLLVEAKAAANHAMDAHLAALAVEWGLELVTGDRGFARFPGLRWRDPLAGVRPSADVPAVGDGPYQSPVAIWSRCPMTRRRRPDKTRSGSPSSTSHTT